MVDFGVAILSVAVALGLTLLLAPWLYPTVTPLFLVAVMVSAWSGGWESGLLATILSTLAINYFFIEPRYSLQIVNLGTVVQLSTFLTAAGLISGLNQSRRAVLVDARANYQMLQETVEREAAAQTRSSQTEEALRQSETRLRAVAANLPQGAVFVVDRNLRYLLAEGQAIELAGMTSEDLVGKTIWEALDPALANYYEPYFHQALNGVPFSHEHYSHDRHYVSHGTPLVSDQGEVYAVLAVSYDITDRKQAEAQLHRVADLDAFRVVLSDALRSLSNPVEIQAEACRLLGEHLGVDRAYYVEVNEAESYARVNQNYLRSDSPSLVGTFRLVDYGWIVPHLQRGESIIITDAETSNLIPEAERTAMAAVRIAAHITIPLVKAGGLVGALCVTEFQPRQWSETEIELVCETAERIWTTIERARAEAALRQSEAKYRSLFESIDEGFNLLEMMLDEAGNPCDFRIVETNPAWEQQTGLANATGKTLLEIAPTFERQWIDFYSNVVLSGKAARTEYYTEPVQRWYNVFASRVGSAGSHQVAVVFNDITERVRVEDERKRRAANLAFLAEIQSDCARLTTADEMMQAIGAKIGSYLNLAICAFVDIDEAQDQAIVHHHWHRADAPNLTGTYRISEFVTEAFYTAARAGGMVIVNDTNTDVRTNAENCAALNVQAFIHVPFLRDGQWKFLFNGYDSHPRQWRQDEIELFRELANQIFPRLERARAEAEREQLLIREQAARAEAEQANRIKDEFLAVLSHELRSPLNPILGWAKLLQAGNLGAVKTTQAITTIERNAKLQSELIEDLLDVSRILQGKLSLNASPVDLAATIRGAIETVRIAAEAKSITVAATLNQVGKVSGDATRLQQVVWNLLSNAVKFTPVGGQVEVRLEQVECQAQITVSDNGKGIPVNFLPYVFDYFRQEDSATTRKFGGLGLGLAIVRHLVELHGGTVAVASEGEGMGATFTVNLPLLRTENPELRTENLALNTQPSDFSPLEGLQILVIDDEPDSREFVAFVLEQAGASVRTATTASEGFVALTQSSPDVLISDIGMPDMDGYMLMRQVRALPPEQGGQVKAIALTAYAGDFNQQQALEVGFQQHVSKPVEPAALVQTIRALLSG